MGILDKLKGWLTPATPPAPAPTPKPEPERKPTTVADYVRVWQLLRNVQWRQVWPALITIPVIVFFAVSGFVAWAALALGLILRFVRLGLGV